MEANRKSNENESVNPKKAVCDVEALKKCLEENKGDQIKCQHHIEAFRNSCSIKTPKSSSDSS
ncbi:hypothetical protein CASFOL_006906 [Castilleja foliolosa]|uniref:CHCH domain-containing protein n=1 Tax=Castilleja foliolosa TaxID=1961234 RepID=A0ABD3E7P6_9LAMI